MGGPPFESVMGLPCSVFTHLSLDAYATCKRGVFSCLVALLMFEDHL